MYMAAKVEEAREILKRYGYNCSTTAKDLAGWFDATTTREDVGLEEVLKEPLLIVHELIEIEQIKRSGLKITRDVIIKNPEEVEEAHLRATEVELEIASLSGNCEYLRNRLEHVRAWSEDPSAPAAYRKRYRDLWERMRR